MTLIEKDSKYTVCYKLSTFSQSLSEICHKWNSYFRFLMCSSGGAINLRFHCFPKIKLHQWLVRRLRYPRNRTFSLLLRNTTFSWSRTPKKWAGATFSWNNTLFLMSLGRSSIHLRRCSPRNRWNSCTFNIWSEKLHSLQKICQVLLQMT